MKLMKAMTMNTIIRTYSELITLPTFMERYKYLRIGGTVGTDTFGFDRYLNQVFYKSEEWKSIRRHICHGEFIITPYDEDNTGFYTVNVRVDTNDNLLKKRRVVLSIKKNNSQK